jgi:DnaK suppressor protein
MPAKKPSNKAKKAKKTVSAKSTAKRPAAAKTKSAPGKSAAPKKVVKKAAKAPVRKTAKTSGAAKAKTSGAAKKKVTTGKPAVGGSLLSGPRNVQPYVSSHGEDYMNPEQLGHFRTILTSWKTDLMQEVDRTVLHMKDEAANFPDPNDRATQESEFSLELRTRDRERKLIRKIDEALARIEDGSYGYCLETGEPIGVKRLEARPVATLSVEAQERRERREKQFGDRDDYR